MTQLIQYSGVGEGQELTSPDAVHVVKIDAVHTDGTYELFEVDAPRGPATALHRTNWPKAYYVLQGRMIVQVDSEGYDLGPGSSVAIPQDALHTFTVITPSTKFLAFSLSGAMGRFLADIDASVSPGRPPEESARDLQQVLARHDVSVAGIEPVP